ncbi:sulfotransferase family protein [Rhodohalobacter sp. 614A]|uniref:sulfotransferase family protein n=1 Tax=Rhodohalobacter sp. 614A TaxID=2908649 RepID=UPI001F2D5DF7|nr:sulfotransferase [Rhodohalobacter sp. 614A]
MSDTPYFIGIGAMRCGSTWISQVLSEHPEVYIPASLKEVHFFDAFYKNSKRDKKERWNYGRGIEWYMNLLNEGGSHLKSGEITPNYLYDNEAPNLIKQDFPDVKIIVSLRDKVERSLSHFQFVKMHNYLETTGDDLADYKKYDSDYHFSDYSHYEERLKRYHELFDDILVINFEDIKERPSIVCKQLYGFLGIEDEFQPACLNKKMNKSRGKRSDFLYEVFKKTRKKVKKNRGLVKVSNATGFTNVFKFLNRLNLSEKKEVSDDLKEYVEGLFAASDVKEKSNQI